MVTKSHPSESEKKKDKEGHDKGFGCLKIDQCGLGHPFICQLKNPDCDEETNRFKGYLIQLLGDATAASKVCTGSCKAGTGIANLFDHKKSLIDRSNKKVARQQKRADRKAGKKNKKGGKAKGKKKTKTSGGIIGGLTGLGGLFF